MRLSIALPVLALALSIPLASASGQSASKAARPADPRLHLELVGSDSTSFDVVATMIVGSTEVLLWDAQYHVADARRLADRIAATGKKLKAIIISHPDHDHFSGAAAIVERFPGTPVYMTPEALAEFSKTGPRDFQNEKRRSPALLADSVVTPKPLPTPRLSVDGEVVEVIPNLMGDVGVATNSILWIPALRAVLAGDVVFQNVHPWLAVSTVETRMQWRSSLQRIAQLKPAIVVAGHKKDVNAPDSPESVQRMLQYLDDFDANAKSSSSADQLIRRMNEKYSDWAVPLLLRASAFSAIPVPTPGGVNAQQAREIIAAGNVAWGKARVAYDRAVFEKMLAPDFWVKTAPANPRQDRSQFIGMVSAQGPLRLTRFDARVLTVQPDGDDGWAAIIQEKLESEGTRPDGTPARAYALWITRDGWRKVDGEWKIAYSEAVSMEQWLNTRPPITDW